MITKENINQLLNELGKEIKRDYGKNANVELVIVGGASILLNYDFRDMTMDIDAMKDSFSSLGSCIRKVGDKFDLPDEWLNFDFKNTDSYTPNLREHSQYYRTFSNVLKVYTVKDEYLLCMKLIAFRDNGRDIMDSINLMKSIPNMTFKKLDQAMRSLYGGWNGVKPEAKELVANAFQMEKERSNLRSRGRDLEP